MDGRHLARSLEADLVELGHLGWGGRDARWIRLVCQHSGMFVRTQYIHHHRCHRSSATRFAQKLVERGIARDHPLPRTVTGPEGMSHLRQGCLSGSREL